MVNKRFRLWKQGNQFVKFWQDKLKWEGYPNRFYPPSPIAVNGLIAAIKGLE